jgi:serine/threonine protein kinase
MMRDSFISVIELSKYNTSTHSTNEGDQSIEYDYPIDNLSIRALIPGTLKSTDFTAVKFLDNGSNCSVFTASLHGKKVVVKMVKERPKNSVTADSEIILEADVLSRIDHPNIITIYGTGEKIRNFIVMEHLEGGTLAQMLNFEDRATKSSPQSGKKNTAYRQNQISVMPVLDIINIAEAIARALKFLHEEIHPDVMIIHRGNHLFFIRKNTKFQ